MQACQQVPEKLTVEQWLLRGEEGQELIDGVPDVYVECPEDRAAQIEADPVLDTNTRVFPQILVEVLSKSTGHRDITDKLADYQSLVYVRHYLVIDPERCTLFHFSRDRFETPWQVSPGSAESELLLGELAVSAAEFF